jgi:2-haloacid dehalogenase
MIDFSQFEYISFDCYGTLINWEAGLLGFLRPLLQRKGCQADDAAILNLYSEFEPREQSGEYRSYREVLASIVRDFARELHFEVTADEANGLANSISDWQPFSDTVAGLKRLHSGYKLAVLSNIDDDLFALTAPKLEERFDQVVTAQQARGYKPAPLNFELLLERLAVPPSRLLHAAESLYHDVIPARSLGITTVWVNRRQGRDAAATKLVAAQPDLEVKDITELAELAGV